MIRVLLLDDHEIFVESLARLLAVERDMDVVAHATTTEEAVRLASDTRPDVAIVDYQLAEGDGTQATAAIKTVSPATRVVMLTGRTDDRVLIAAIDAGCSGFVTKDKALSELVHAVRVVHEGEAYLTSQMLAGLLPRLGSRPADIGGSLTPREVEVLDLMAEGLANDVIAERLHLSRHTVRNHVQSILGKLHAHSKLQAVVIATREGLLEH